MLEKCWLNNNNSKNKQNIKEGFVAVTSALMVDVTDGNWYLDGGASNHMCTDKSIFVKIVADNTPVRVGNKDLIQVVKVLFVFKSKQLTLSLS